MSKVSLTKAKSNSPSDLKKGIERAVNSIGFKPKFPVNNIVIKVNLCYYWNASTGHTTDPALVSAMADYLREIYGNDVRIKIAEADASAMQTKYAFRLLGYKRLAEEKNLDLLNLSEDVIQKTEVQVDKHKMVLEVPQTLLQSDLFINMPKLKVMRRVHITCAMKNLFGAIAYPRKVTYHKNLEKVIVGINKILKPNLNVVDGLVGLGQYPVRLNLIMAGADTFAVDWVAAQVMGYKPSKIGFLKLAIKERIGDPRDISVLDGNVQTFRRVFPTENNVSARLKMGLQFSLIKAYSRVVGDIIPPSIEET